MIANARGRFCINAIGSEIPADSFGEFLQSFFRAGIGHLSIDAADIPIEGIRLAIRTRDASQVLYASSFCRSGYRISSYMRLVCVFPSLYLWAHAETRDADDEHRFCRMSDVRYPRLVQIDLISLLGSDTLDTLFSMDGASSVD